MTNLKIVILGSGSVGKSAVTIQYVNGEFVDQYDPTIEDMYRKVIEFNGDHIMLEIMDTAGTENFLVMRDLYIRNGQGFILVYSITAKSTFYELDNIKEQVCRVKDSTTSRIPMVVLGNKCDLEKDRQVASKEGQDLVEKWGGNVDFLETSAKSKINISAAFDQLVKQIRSKDPSKSKKKRTSGGGLIIHSLLLLATAFTQKNVYLINVKDDE
ncbi:Ras GTPase [Heterostelium album PN500]|uniref:small monomeric GTPase n=1 Tax=Heterostelium pallidum (strain ATCC 26659 / Pp 5 / PN500) TaxID=670386 RepID=D3BK31_HETP5|nr:Ras GTPase [Heterostelium album PN500]EFA78261.1 Ras GTPase [Heterostelium album PN500]|eukprot:XP_020430386.1 Ras GTPase [Heterostelium album PN500]